MDIYILSAQDPYALGDDWNIVLVTTDYNKITERLAKLKKAEIECAVERWRDEQYIGRTWYDYEVYHKP